MTAVPTTPAPVSPGAARPVSRRSAVQRTAGWLLSTHLYLAAWFWGIVLVAATLALAFWSLVVGVPTQSVVSVSRQGAIWFPFSLFIMVVAAYLPVHVGMGMTRRALVRGALLTAVAMAAVYAVTLSVLFQLEGVVFEAFGWVHGPGDMWSSGADGPVDAAAEHFLIFLAANVSGLLVSIVYYRFGGWLGTLALPLTCAPILLVSGLGLAVAGPFDTAAWFDRFALDRPVAAAFAVVVLAATALTFGALTRRVEVHTAPA